MSHLDKEWDDKMERNLEYQEMMNPSKTVFTCPSCRSQGFEPSKNGKRCSWCDGTESGNPPEETKMDMDTYQRLAMRTRAEYRDQHDQLVNAALGLSGESGEFADLIKKMLHHGHGLDADKAEKELGDILWYVAEACDAMEINMSAIANRNIDKLRARYPEGFETERSINRDVSKE